MNTRTIVTVVAALVVAGIVAAIDVLVEPVAPPDEALLTSGGPDVAAGQEEVVRRAGQAVCAIGEQASDTALSLIVANVSVPQGDELNAGVSHSSDPAFTQLRIQRAGQLAANERRGLEPAQAFAYEPDDVAVVRWWDAPVVSHREWVIDAGDLPAGIVAGACETAVSDTWIIPGLFTSGGAEARVAITNPYRGDASVAIRFLSPDGPETPLALQNVSVAGRDTVEIGINEILPERDDLAMIVEVQAGRVSVEGLQFVRSAIGGIEGASLLRAAPQAAEQWHLPWVANTGAATSWLWIVNPSEQEAIVELSALTPQGGTLLDGGDEITLAPEEMRRVDLDASWPAELDVAALSVRSDGTPIVVSAGTQIDASNVQDTALIVQPAVDTLDHVWVVPFLAAAGRDEQLHIANPGSEHAVVDVFLRTAQGELQPTALQEVHVAPGSRTALDLRGQLPLGDVSGDDTNDGEGTQDDADPATNGDNGAAEPEPGAAPDDEPAETDANDGADDDAVGDQAAPENDVEASGEPFERTTDDVVTAVVVARGGPVVVGRVGAEIEGYRRLVAIPGIPSRTWVSPGVIPLDGMILGMTQRIDTILGHTVTGPLGAREPRAAFVMPESVGAPFMDAARATQPPQVDAIPGAPVETVVPDDAADDDDVVDTDGDGVGDTADTGSGAG